MTYPRVLHVGFQPIGAPTNSGLTLATMFGAWPDDKLLQVCLRDHPAPGVRRGAIVMPLAVAPLDGAVRTLLGRGMPAGVVDGMNNAVERVDKMPLRTRARIMATVANDLGPVHLPRSTVDAVERFRPQVVHSLLGGVRAMKIAAAFSERFDVPLVPHFMDDWVTTLFAHGQLFGVARSAVDRQFARCLNRAPLVLTIGDKMAAEFTRMLDRPAIVVGNSVDFGDYDRFRVSSNPVGETRTLRYVGGLHLGRLEVIDSLASILQEDETGRNWIIELYVPMSDASLAAAMASRLANVRFSGSLDPVQVPEVLVGADALLFIESTDANVFAFTRLSVSTKVPQYAASARPVLVVGPPDQASIEALMKAGLGFHVARLRRQEVTDALSLMDHAVNDRTDATARTPWVSSTFSSSTTQDRLRAAIEQAALSLGGPRS